MVRLFVLVAMLLTSVSVWGPTLEAGRHDVAHARQPAKATLLASSALQETLGDVDDDDDWGGVGATLAAVFRHAAVADSPRFVATAPSSYRSHRHDDERAFIRRARGYAHLPRMDLVV